jgi:hypothetical protein
VPKATTGGAPILPDAGHIVSPALIRHRMQNQGGGWKTIVGLGVLLLTIAALVLGGLMFTLKGSRKGEEDIGRDPSVEVLNGIFFNRENKEERVFRLALGSGIWKANEDFKRPLKAVVALERAMDSAVARLAISVQDFGKQMPRDAELLKGAIERLEGLFGPDLQLEEQPEKGELAGQPARVLRFLGGINNVEWKGECYALAHNGLAYWVFVAEAPPGEEAPKALGELREKGRGLFLADIRKGWSERPPPQATFAGLKTRFTISGREAVWESVDNPRDADPNAELLLQGKDLEERKDNLKRATILVVSLPKGGTDSKAALKAAREYLEEAKKEENKGYKLELVKKNKEDVPSDDGQELKAGNCEGRMIELELVRERESIKYILLAAVPLGEQTLALQCEAHWQHHQAWRRDFLDLLATLKLGKGGSN